MRYGGSTEAKRAASFVAAAEKGGVGGFLDDSALKGQQSALPAARAAYHHACVKRNVREAQLVRQGGEGNGSC